MMRVLPTLLASSVGTMVGPPSHRVLRFSYVFSYTAIILLMCLFSFNHFVSCEVTCSPSWEGVGVYVVKLVGRLWPFLGR